MYPFRTRESPRALPAQAKVPCKSEEADARTRTGDPFITRERQVGDARPRPGTRGRVFPVDHTVSALWQWTRVPARARADVPVLYPAEPRSGQTRKRCEGLAALASDPVLRAVRLAARLHEKQERVSGHLQADCVSRSGLSFGRSRPSPQRGRGLPPSYRGG